MLDGPVLATLLRLAAPTAALYGMVMVAVMHRELGFHVGRR
jgi:hypothetical protein